MIDTSLIPKPENTTKVVKKLGDTQDIIESIIRVDQKYRSKEFDRFARQFDTKDGLKRLWDFVKHQIEYKKDDFDKSLQLTPAALWKKKSGDCKSKTLFVNAVLRALNVPYIIRFTSYSATNKDVKHVYTVAVIDGKEIPIDTVYKVFGKEKKYKYKKDYPMAEIVEISGFNPVVAKQPLPTRKQMVDAANVGNDPRVIKKQEEIRQKQQYVKPQEPIPFNKISEAEASLRIQRNELELIQVLRPDRAKLAEKGLKLINRAIKGDFSCGGVIPNELAGTVKKIKFAEKQQHRSAMSFGIDQETKNILGRITKEERKKSSINDLYHRKCFEQGMFIDRKMDATSMINNPNGQIHWQSTDFWPPKGMNQQGQWANGTYGGCIYNFPNTVASNPEYYPPGATTNAKFGNTGGTNFYRDVMTGAQHLQGNYVDHNIDYLFDARVPNFGYTSLSSSESHHLANNQNALLDAQMDKMINGGTFWDNHLMLVRYGEVAYYNYGHKSIYRKNYFQVKDDFDQALMNMVNNSMIQGGTDQGWYSFYVQYQSELDAVILELNQASGILSDQVNDVYRSDNSLNGTGSMGSALLYTFLSSTNVSINTFPTQVQLKGGFQNQFLDACNKFSGVSRSNVQGMARNGILYNTGGEQPEYILKNCWALSKGNTDPQIGYMPIGEIITIIGLIATFLTGVIKIIADSIYRGQMMEAEAKRIDALAANMSDFPPVGGNNKPDPTDWELELAAQTLLQEEAEEDRKKKLMLMGAGLLGAVVLLGEDEK